MIKKFSDYIIKGRWIILAIFVALAVLGTVMVFHTKILYDLSSYAPSGSNTSQAVEVMKREFDDKGSAYIMVKGVSLEEASALQGELSKIVGVATVSFDPVKDYKNNNVLYTVLLSDYDGTVSSFAAVERIIDFLSDKEAYLSGQSASSYYTKLETFESIFKVGIVIALAILLMLFFTSKTYFEIVIMLLVFGVSVIINMGTNFIFNGISYVSNLVSLVLQLALSIDYSVILLHRFMEERQTADIKTAASRALSKGMIEILSSSLTTIAGLCALLLMTLPIGVEMGLSLAKGIVASLLCVIFLMPALLVFFAKPLEKTKHKSFVPAVTKPAKAIIKARYIIVPVFIVIVALAAFGQFNNEYAFNINGGARIVASNDKVVEEFGVLNNLVVIVPKGDYQKEKELTEYILNKSSVNSAIGLSTIEVMEGLMLTDEVNVAELVALASSLGMTQAQINLLFTLYIAQNDPDTETPRAEYRVALINLLEFAYSMADMLSEEYAAALSQLIAARANFEGKDYSRIMFNIDSGIESKESLALVEELLSELGQFYNEFYLAGESVACYDMAKAFPGDKLRISLFTVFFVLLILLFTFKNLALPLLLIIAIQGGIWINFVFPYLLGSSVSFIGYLLISAIQMGATIDYGIILSSRYKSTKLIFPDKLDAMAQAENAVFPTIITSGSILTITGFALGVLASGVVANMGMLLGIGALTSMLVVIFVLPSLLLVFDKITDKAELGILIRKFQKNKKK
ncbi:MAG: hypothetical protein EOM87_04730 [Clostridia bacterium]|nr:hypothetical protein [Clostridia bacterium]